jgi:hypothetical protein
MIYKSKLHGIGLQFFGVPNLDAKAENRQKILQKMTTPSRPMTAKEIPRHSAPRLKTWPTISSPICRINLTS